MKTNNHADALVFYGVTGDLAFKKIFPALQAMVKRLFAREDYVEEAWRIVDPILKDDSPVYEYDPKTWGPPEVERLTPGGGWHNPRNSNVMKIEIWRKPCSIAYRP